MNKEMEKKNKLSGWIVLKQGGNGVAKDWVSGMKMIRI
jgi:hypothetical protein